VDDDVIQNLALAVHHRQLSRCDIAIGRLFDLFRPPGAITAASTSELLTDPANSLTMIRSLQAQRTLCSHSSDWPRN
jgi:hypothetical protein